MRRTKFIGFRGLLCAAALMALTAAAPSPVAASDAPQTVAQFQADLLNVMKAGKTLGFSGRFKKLAPEMDKGFDFLAMTQLAFGENWDSASDAQKKQAVEAFRRFSISNYAYEFSDFSGETFEIIGEPRQGHSGVLIKTTLTPKDSDPVTLGYLVHETPDGWKIYDVLFNGTISELARRRQEFTAVIRDHGIDGLIAQLTDKSDSFAQSSTQ